ncbi:hypothetical protein RhiirA5_422341 [Rhizophagus irregularis]|uniref:Uncharacterized protein n=1 Tax=Rhizophagus irregularis TaxID=588596 RepID=A0A2N0PC13_9GLOM|nr:hypothetical protein RhiirA5_422341 [Rhizophagus irregularis]PKC57588.1 hypothetical protein RhiirA1_472266 [Rhizophagus irregularis]
MTVAFSFLVVLVSSCSPGNSDEFITINLISSTFRFNILGFNPFPNNSVAEIGTWDTGYQPTGNEVFVLKQPITGVYEFWPFISFYQNMIIEIPNGHIHNSGVPLIISQSINNSDNERFIIECDTCNLNANGLEIWVKYHSSCSIKNLASGFCMNGEYLPANLVTQVDCSIASRWDIFGISPDNAPFSTIRSSTMVNSTSGVISKHGLVGVIIGLISGTASISFIISYCIIKHKFSKTVQSLRIAHAINN